MREKMRFGFSVFWTLVGALLVGLSVAEVIDNFWSGMGGGLLAVGGLQVHRQLKYRRNEAYREKVDIAMQDERNRFIRGKAWAWAGYLFVIIAAVGSLILRFSGKSELADLAACGMGLLVLLYWGSYMVLSRKY